jgi:hypothetical protein
MQERRGSKPATSRKIGSTRCCRFLQTPRIAVVLGRPSCWIRPVRSTGRSIRIGGACRTRLVMIANAVLAGCLEVAGLSIEVGAQRDALGRYQAVLTAACSGARLLRIRRAPPTLLYSLGLALMGVIEHALQRQRQILQTERCSQRAGWTDQNAEPDDRRQPTAQTPRAG